MPEPAIRIEDPMPMTATQHRALLQAAYDRKPTPLLRARLALIASRLNEPQRVIMILQDENNLDSAETLMLVDAWLRVPRAEALNRAASAIERMLDGDIAPEVRSAALTHQAQIAMARQDRATARRHFLSALQTDPSNQRACARLMRIEAATGNADALAALADRLSAHGIIHPYAMVTRRLAHVHRGETEAADALTAMATLHRTIALAPPAGWADMTAFNEALAAELLSHPDLRRTEHGGFAESSQLINNPLTADSPLARQLMEQIAAVLAREINLLSTIDHPWIRHRPPFVRLTTAVRIADRDDHESWHVHPTGWFNGVYYVQIPEAVTVGADRAGCIAFGLPPKLAGSAGSDRTSLHIIRPRAGTMMLFPSFSHHRTFAHGTDTARIAVTFELRVEQ